MNSLIHIGWSKIITTLILVFAIYTNYAQNTMLYNNGVELYVNESSILQVEGNVENDFGRLINGGMIVVKGDLINNDSLMSLNDNPSYTITKDWINNAVFIPENSQVIFIGNNQYIKGQPTTFYKLKLNDNNVIQEVDLIVKNQLDLDACELELIDNRLVIENENVDALIRSTGYVNTDGGGYLRRNMGTGVYMFPVGSRSLSATNPVRPVFLTNSSNDILNFEVALRSADASIDGYDRSKKSEDICEINAKYYHEIVISNSSNPRVDVEIPFIPAQDGEYNQLAYWENSSSEWNKVIAIEKEDNFILDGANYQLIKLKQWADFSDSVFALASDVIPYQLQTQEDVDCKSHMTTIDISEQNSFTLDSVIWQNFIPDEAVIVAEGNDGFSIEVLLDNNPSSDQIALPYELFAQGCVNRDTLYINSQSQIALDTLTMNRTTCDPLQVGDTLEVLESVSGCDSVVLDVTTTLGVGDSSSVLISDCSRPDTVITEYFNRQGQCDSAVTFIFECEIVNQLVINLPTIFSPNNDGENDELKAYTNMILENFSMKVFDRWGNMVFGSEDIAKGWDGSFDGKAMNSGLFLVKVEASTKDQSSKTVQQVKLIK